MFRSKGYKVSLKGRSGILYVEDKRKAVIEAEMMVGSPDLVIYFDRFSSWEPPFDKEILTDQDRRRIRRNVSLELENKGLELEWE